MKIEKKHIIVLAIVAAVVCYLLWQKGVFAKAAAKVTDTAGTDTGTASADSVEGVIAASGMTSTDAAYVRNFQRSIEASDDLKNQEEIKAAGRGYTYAQMLVLDAIWTKYYDLTTKSFKSGTSDSTKSYVWKVQSAIKNM